MHIPHRITTRVSHKQRGLLRGSSPCSWSLEVRQPGFNKFKSFSTSLIRHIWTTQLSTYIDLVMSNSVPCQLCFLYVLRDDLPHFVGDNPQKWGLWHWNSNSTKIFVQCTYPPIILCLIIKKLSCWKTNKHRDYVRNIHLTLLLYAGGELSQHVTDVGWMVRSTKAQQF